MKQIFITGRIGKDAVLRRTQNGDPVLGFTAAVDDGYGESKSTIWFDCSIWGKRGESLAQYLVKGVRITAIGDFGMREYDGKSYPTIRINEINWDGGKREAKPENRQSYGNQSGAPANFGTNDLDDSIPF